MCRFSFDSCVKMAPILIFAFFLASLSSISAELYPFGGHSKSSTGSSGMHNGRPKLKRFQFGNDLIDHKSVRVFCQLDSGSQPVSFKWLKDGLPLSTASAHIKIEGSSDYSSLAIASLNGRRDNGNYSCLATNSYGTERHSSLLIVQEPPVFEEKPDDISVGLGQNQILTCRATSPYTVPQIRWYRVHENTNSNSNNNDGVSVSPSDASRVHVASGEQLNLVNLRPDDAGLYECVADAHNDLVISHLFSVTINVPPSFDTKNGQFEVKRGDVARLECDVHGARPMHIKWFVRDFKSGTYKELNLDAEQFTFPRISSVEKNDAEHSHGQDVHQRRRFINNNRTEFELVIHGVNTSDNGRYQCHAENAFGKAVRTVDLLVQDVPGIVRDVQINQIWSRDISLNWYTPDVTGNLPLTEYIVQYWKELKSPAGGGGGGQQLHELNVLPTEKQCTIRNLAPGTAYVVRAIAVNRFGQGSPSTLVRVITAEEAPNAAPIDIHAEALSTTSLKIRWKAPPRSHWNGQLRGYYLGYRPLDTNAGSGTSDDEPSGFYYKEIPIQGEASDVVQEEFTLGELQRATKYSLILKAHNGIGEGPSSQEITVSTATNDPPSKARLWSTETKENSVILKWEQKPNAGNHFVFYYREERKNSWSEVLYQNVASSDAGDSDVSTMGAAAVTGESSGRSSKHNSCENCFELTGLQRGSVYLIYMRSMTDQSALSEPSDTIKIRTSGSEAVYSPLDGASGVYPVVPTFVPTMISPYSLSSSNIPPYLRLSFILPIAIAAVIISVACVGAYVYVQIDDRKARLKTMTSLSCGGGNGGNGGIYGGTIAISPGKRFHYVTGPGPFPGQSMAFSPKHDSGFAGGAETQSLVSEESSMSFRYTDAGADHKKLLNNGGQRMTQLPGLQPWAQAPILEEDEAIVEVDSCTYETLPFQRTATNQHGQPMTSTPLKSFAGYGGSAVDTLPSPPPLPGTGGAKSAFMAPSAASTMSRKSFPAPPSPLPGANSRATPKQMNDANLPNSAFHDSAQFCHVDVHHVQSALNISETNNSDSYDDFHLFGAQV